MIIHSFRFLHVHRLAAADVLPAHRAFVNPFRALSAANQVEEEEEEDEDEDELETSALKDFFPQNIQIM